MKNSELVARLRSIRVLAALARTSPLLYDILDRELYGIQKEISTSGTDGQCFVSITAPPRTQGAE